jgi:hypothetical protein
MHVMAESLANHWPCYPEGRCDCVARARDQSGTVTDGRIGPKRKRRHRGVTALAHRLEALTDIDAHITIFHCGSAFGEGPGATPTFNELQELDAVLVWSTYPFVNGAALGNVLANSAAVWLQLNTISTPAVTSVTIMISRVTGKQMATPPTQWHTHSAAYTGCTGGLVPNIAGHPLLDGVTSFDGGFGGCILNAALVGGATGVAS